MSEQEPTRFQILVSREWEGGVYSNFVSAWHSPYEFTLDFCATQRPQPADSDDDTGGTIIPCRAVARVRIPVTLAFDVIRAMNDNMTRYEERFGEIVRPGDEEDS